MSTIHNPVLPGFHPDPSILRVGNDFYLATSTFEWFPGVQIHHSRDLIHWRLLTRPLDRVSQLDLAGVPDSGGVWAPCLTYHDGTFYLVYTAVHALNTVTKDSPNFLVTAVDVEGPWSEPIFLNASGFDPSLFHDDDGRQWLVNMVWDHRPGRSPFYGIALQEYAAQERALVGDAHLIFTGTHLGCTEGPHLYQRGGYYYLMTAEGGTSYDHAVTLARSRDLRGPYEVHPSNPVLTASGDRTLPLQKAGHADLVDTQDGDWYLAHLAARPLPDSDRCPLGRETALQKVEWRDDGWLYLTGGGNRPRTEVPAPSLPEHPWPAAGPRDDFDAAVLRLDYQTPRTPLLAGEDYSLTERPGHLRLYGGESMQSRFNQVMLARRRQAFRCEATTLLRYTPASFQHMAGLTCFYSTRLYHYLFMSCDEQAGSCLYVQTCDDGQVRYPLGTTFVPLGTVDAVYLQVRLDGGALTFLYSLDGEAWHRVGEDLDASILSDDYGEAWGFTGTFIGLACQDLTGHRHPADFDFFEYRELDAARPVEPAAAA